MGDTYNAGGILGGAAALIGSVYKIARGIKQDRMARRVVVPGADYTQNPMVDTANNMFNGEMPGQEVAKDNILANQDSTISAADRNASSGSQALAILSAIQGQTNNAFQGLQQQATSYKLNAFNNLNSVVTQDHQMEYGDDIRKRQEAIGEKNALRGSSGANVSNGINDISTVGYLMSMMKNNNNN